MGNVQMANAAMSEFGSQVCPQILVSIFPFPCSFKKVASSTLSNFKQISKANTVHQGPSNDDDDGSENITKKMNLRPFKLNRVYLEPLNYSNVGDFSWS